MKGNFSKMADLDSKIVRFVEACLINETGFLNNFMTLLETSSESARRNFQTALYTLELPFDLDFLGFELLQEAYKQNVKTDQLLLAINVAMKMHQHRKRTEPNLLPVWTGPVFGESPITHKTYDTVKHLFQKVKYEVFLVGYAFSLEHDYVRSLFNELIEATKRGCKIDIIFHQNDHNLINIKNNWPDNLQFPNLYYWDRDTDDKWASLHSKLIIVDQSKILLTSANFTLHGFEKNIETGVMIENHPIVQLYWRQFRSLLNNKEMKKY